MIQQGHYAKEEVRGALHLETIDRTSSSRSSTVLASETHMNSHTFLHIFLYVEGFTALNNHCCQHLWLLTMCIYTLSADP